MYVMGFSCDPDAVTQATGLTPANVWFAGALIGRGIQRCRENGWQLDSTLVDEPDPEVHVQHLLRRLPADFHARLSSVSPKFEIQVALIIEFGEQTPPLAFTAETISLLAANGASLDVDTYVVPAEGEA